MIASVRGEVLDIALDHVVIEAAGVGYKVMATPMTLATLHRGSDVVARLTVSHPIEPRLDPHRTWHVGHRTRCLRGQP